MQATKVAGANPKRPKEKWETNERSTNQKLEEHDSRKQEERQRDTGNKIPGWGGGQEVEIKTRYESESQNETGNN